MMSSAFDPRHVPLGMAPKTCDRCGLSMMESSEPQEKDGRTYCCSGCAQESDCICD